MREAFIIDAVRTPIGKFGGTLSSIRADNLAALTLREILKRNPTVDISEIDDVILGCANQAGEDNRNVARMALLLAGIPFTVPGITVNRLCASGMSAIVSAANSIKADEGELFISGGLEHMTRGPLVQSKAEFAYSGKVSIYDSTFGWRFVNQEMEKLFGTEGMGETAENIVEKFNISREAQDLFAYNSQMKAAKARTAGRFAKEIVPVIVPKRKSEPVIFKDDEFIKTLTTTEILAKLRPAFRKGGSVTAGNSSGINDGACAMIVASDKSVNKFNLKPKVKIIASSVVGVEPRIMGIGPVFAVKKLLKKVGMTLNQIDIIELNEAFASQSLACIRELGLDDCDERINPNGGAIALGHPLGMSGARIIQTAMIELEEQKKEFAICTLCVGVGQGMAVLLQNVNL